MASKSLEDRAAMAKAIRDGHRTPQGRLNCSNGAKRRYAAMTPEERRAYWHKIHPNGNGHGKNTKTEKP